MSFIYFCTKVEDIFRVGAGGSALQALENLLGLGKGCQGSKIWSILQVSERCLRLCSLAAVDRAGAVAQPCKPWRSFQDQARAVRVPSFEAFCKCLKDVLWEFGNLIKTTTKTAYNSLKPQNRVKKIDLLFIAKLHHCLSILVICFSNSLSFFQH